MKQLRTDQTGEIVIYKDEDGGARIDVRLEQGTVWLTQKQLAALFRTERSVVTKHIRNILKEKELAKGSVSAIFAHTARDGKTYRTMFYNLDMAISVGYRVNSRRGTQFRIWATDILHEHLVKGYTVNVRRLNELRQTVKLIAEIGERHPLSGDEAASVLRVVRDYTFALDLLDDYDHQRVTRAAGTVQAAEPVTYDEAMRVVEQLRIQFDASDLFGRERDGSLTGSLDGVFQTFGGKELYPSMEEKGAHLLYFLVKNHSFVDGNKRIAAALFLWFLEKNRMLYHADGRKRIADNALVAMTLLIAESKPTEKEVMTHVLANLLGEPSRRAAGGTP